MSDTVKKSAMSGKVGQFSVISGQLVLDHEHHQQRVSSLRERQRQFEESSHQLATYMTATSETSLMLTLPSASELPKHRTQLVKVENYTTAGQSNLPTISTLLIARHSDQQTGDKRSAATNSSPTTTAFVHTLQLKNLPSEYRSQGLAESLKILKYFCHAEGPPGRTSNAFLKVFDIFRLLEEHQVMVVEEWFYLENTLQHRMWGQAWTAGVSSLVSVTAFKVFNLYLIFLSRHLS